MANLQDLENAYYDCIKLKSKKECSNELDEYRMLLNKINEYNAKVQSNKSKKKSFFGRYFSPKKRSVKKRKHKSSVKKSKKKY